MPYMAAQQAERKVSAPPRRLVVALVHPSNYDHANGRRGIGSFVQTYRLGVIPSNTLRLMESLTREIAEGGELGDIEVEVHAFEDAIRSQQRAFRRLLRRFPEEGTQLVVGLVAVQSNQFPRACDLMRDARKAGAISVIGGPHITAGINTAFYGISAIDPMREGVPCQKQMPPEIQTLIDDPSVVVFHGDADAQTAWADVLRDIVHHREKPYYEAGLAGDLGPPGHPYSDAQLDAFVSPVAAVDTERGCPFKCHFCAAIQAHGRTVRSRDPQTVLDWVAAQCRSYGKPVTILFASDNLARNAHWRELLTGLQELRATGHAFTIWAEADVRCDSGPNKGFLEEYAKAGGQGLFLGIESINSDNLCEAGKKQNVVEQLPAFFAECRRHGIAPEGGYIIGFDHDTPESIVADVHRLAEVGLARVWFFIKTILPGSQDWAEYRAEGKDLNPDLNEYDSTRVTCDHPRMSGSEWMRAYDSAVATFYSARNMIRVLSHYADPVQRWRLVKGFLWCRWAYLAEKTHPMIAGLYRHRPFAERRPGQSPLSRVRWVAAEAWRHVRYAACFLREYYVFQHVVLETEWRFLSHNRQEWQEEQLRGLRDWIGKTFRRPMTRRWLNNFWVRYGRQRWRLLSPLAAHWHLAMIPHAISEIIYTLRFARVLIRGLRRA